MALDSTYLQVSDGTGDASLMHITGPRSVGSTTIAVDTLVGVPAKFIASSGTVLPTGLMDPTTVTNFYGQISGSALQINGFLPGSTDAGNTAGQIVVIKPNTAWANFMASPITASRIAPSAVTTPALKPTTRYSAGNGGGDMNTASTSYVDMMTIFTYTAGTTNERLFVDLQLQWYVTANAGFAYITATGTGVTPQLTVASRTASTSVTTNNIHNVIDVTAGNTATIKVQAKIVTSGNLYFVNGNVTDGTWSAKLVAYGNN